MWSDRAHELAEMLTTENPERVWGVSPESTYTALDAMVSGNCLKEALDRYYRIELAATNEERDREEYVEFHEHLVQGLELVSDDGHPTEIGAFILRSEKPTYLLRAHVAIYSESSRRLLRDCIAIDDLIPRREYEALIREDHEETFLTPLLGAFRLICVFPDGVEVGTEVAREALDGHKVTSEESARIILYRRVLDSLLGGDTVTAEDVTEEYFGQNGDDVLCDTAIVGTLGRFSANRFDRSGILAAIEEVKTTYEETSNQVADLLSRTGNLELVDESQEVRAADVEEQVDAEIVSPLLDLLATIEHRGLARVDVDYVTSCLDKPVYDCYSALNSVAAVECELQDDLLLFDSIPTTVGGTERYDRYVSFLLDKHASLVERRNQLTETDIAVEGTQVEEVLADRFDEVDDRQLAPTYFAYTLIDPDSLGEETMEKYVGESRGLAQERARLRRWHESRLSSLRSYTALTDRLFSHGLESELDHRVLRIMTPFDDDTFSEYAAQIRRLLEAGYEFRLLTRHTKDPWEWERLRDNLFKPLEANRNQVSIRTYSRYKQYQRITPNTEMSDLSEIGIHGKLHLIGAPREGAALLGSANFMENSYHWNPECGMYTEQTPFVKTATEFFDIVWDLADADQLSFERLQKVPETQFIPSYYK